MAKAKRALSASLDPNLAATAAEGTDELAGALEYFRELAASSKDEEEFVAKVSKGKDKAIAALMTGHKNPSKQKAALRKLFVGLKEQEKQIAAPEVEQAPAPKAKKAKAGKKLPSAPVVQPEAAAVAAVAPAPIELPTDTPRTKFEMRQGGPRPPATPLDVATVSPEAAYPEAFPRQDQVNFIEGVTGEPTINVKQIEAEAAATAGAKQAEKVAGAKAAKAQASVATRAGREAKVAKGGFGRSIKKFARSPLGKGIGAGAAWGFLLMQILDLINGQDEARKEGALGQAASGLDFGARAAGEALNDDVVTDKLLRSAVRGERMNPEIQSADAARRIDEDALRELFDQNRGVLGEIAVPSQPSLAERYAGAGLI